MQNAQSYFVKLCGNEPQVTQATIGKVTLSWNPDDSRWYVEFSDETLNRSYKHHRNAVAYARKMA